MKKILIIEDDPYIADTVEMALADLYELKILNKAEHIAEELSVFLPDLFLIDNYVGQMQASEIVAIIRGNNQYTSIPVILFSGHPDIKNLAKAIAANAYLAKPFGLEELYACIDGVLAQYRFSV